MKNEIKNILESTFNVKHFLVTDYRSYASEVHGRINDLFDKIVEDADTSKFRKTLKAILAQVENGTKTLSDIENVVYAFIFNDHETFNETERANIAKFYLLLWLEEEFNTLFNQLDITLYTTDLKVGKFEYPVEVLELKLNDDYITLVDIDALDTVEFIIRKTKSNNPTKNVCAFDLPFEDIFLAEDMED